MAKKGLSIIIPAYSGLETVAGTLKSISVQSLGVHTELLILQDGPRAELETKIRQSLDSYDFGGAKIKYKILPRNVGRFRTRLEGARLAKYDLLLFIDDRVQLGAGYIKTLTKIKTSPLIGNVIEKRSGGFNPIAVTLSSLRKTLYDSTFESKFPDYFITKNNFEKSPKGTASLYINRQLFIESCKVVSQKKAGSDSRFFNDDTGLMKELIDHGHKILRTSKLTLYYSPRSDFIESVKHLYGRGPRFVDYYINPTSRFFPILLLIYLSIAGSAILAIVEHNHLLFLGILALIITAISAVFLAKTYIEFVNLVIGLPLAALIFSAGVIKGTFIKAVI